MFKVFWSLMTFSLICVVLYVFHTKQPSRPIKIEYFKAVQLEKENEIIKDLNENAAKIKSIYFPEILIKTGIFKANASICYEKPNNFRMTSRSLLGKETDIGSNKDLFWFWSKRMEPSALFYTKHENLSKTRLKTVFQPNWIMSILSINQIDTKNAYIFDYKDKLCVVQNNNCEINGSPIIRVYLIDKEKKTFCGHYMFDSNQNPIVSLEIKNYYFQKGVYLPKVISIEWHQEKISSVWYVQSCPTLNVNFDEFKWKMPLINKKIDLNGY